MDIVTQSYTWIMTHLGDITDAIAYLCLFASIIVKLTPTLKDDDFFKPIIKFIGKYIALNKYGPTK